MMNELINLKGIGPKKIAALNKLGIYTVEDLITDYPYKYNILKRTDMSLIKDGDKVIIDGVVETMPTIASTNQAIKKTVFRLSDARTIYQICLFNQQYLCRELHPGEKVIIIGKYDQRRNMIVASEIRKGIITNPPTIEAIYYQKEGINSKTISMAIELALNSNLKLENYIPISIQKKYHFQDKLSALKEIHHPTSTMNYLYAKQQIKYEELFLYLLKIQFLKQKRQEEKKTQTRKISKKKVLDFISTLPFELTKDQITTIKEIYQDLTSNQRMNRLVQGDVGSGKTIVSFIAYYMNYLSKSQTALMVPTEILAIQHYENAKNLFQNEQMNIALLTSSTKKKEKDKIYQDLSNGTIDFIIGTQSLIQKNIAFHNLGLIITDEQHRFGVNQRNILKTKGLSPDILSMSATPIPRTYALTLYGDMEVSNIKSKPVGRKTIITKFILESKIKDALYLMKEQILSHHQIYVIAPSIDSQEDDNLGNITILKNKMRLAFGKIATIGIVHGKMKSSEKEKVMHDFETGTIAILISTTVIEVGVNVPNASMIVIFQADLFGLSTLHQLRGRVGRGSTQSYCLLISKVPSKRLKFLEKTTDGFQVSEYDFKTRGEGDLFGTRQSGEAILKLANIKRDFTMLKKVKEDVEIFSKNNKEEFHKLESSLERIELVD